MLNELWARAFARHPVSSDNRVARFQYGPGPQTLHAPPAAQSDLKAVARDAFRSGSVCGAAAAERACPCRLGGSDREVCAVSIP
jgi:hypothetical protein